MNEDHVNLKFRLYEQKIQKLQNEIERQQSINEEIQKRFQVLVNEINNIKDRLNIR